MTPGRGLVLLAAALAAASCSRHEDSSPPAPAAASTISAAPRAALVPPADFPRDVPIYPGATLTASVEPPKPGETGSRVVLETRDEPKEVGKFYLSRLAGWKTAMDMSTADGRALILRSPDGKRSLTVEATREPLRTLVTLTAK